MSGNLTLRERNRRAKKQKNKHLFHNNLILGVVESSVNYVESTLSACCETSPHCRRANRLLPLLPVSAVKRFL